MRGNGVRELVLGAAAAFIAALTLTPLGGPTEHHVWPLEEIVPALEHPLDIASSVNLIGNLLLFVPFGFALVGFRLRPVVAVAFGGAFSTCIEIAQHFISGRTSATDDILLNTAGTAIGYFVATRVSRRVSAFQGWATGREPGASSRQRDPTSSSRRVRERPRP
jgi:glycopeptide antibiotics resistance protein